MADLDAVRRSATRAATDPALWPETLWWLGQAMGGEMTVLERFDKASGAVEIGFSDRPDITARMRQDYESHYFWTCPRWRLSMVSPPFATLHDDLIGNDAALDRTEFYADFLPGFGLRYFLGTPVVDDAAQTLVVSIQRAPDRGRFTDEERARFERLLPDLRNAMAIHARIGHPLLGQALAAVWNRVPEPIAIVGAEAELHFANRAMDDLIAAGDVVRLEGARVRGAGGQVQRAIDAVLGGAAGDRGASLGAARCEGIYFRAAALELEASSEFAKPGIRLFCLLIDDPRRPRWHAVHDAMRMFGLTRAEAAVGSHVAEGLGVDEVAVRLGVSRNTVRTHLAMLRDKLGVHSTLAVANEMRRAAGPFG